MVDPFFDVEKCKREIQESAALPYALAACKRLIASVKSGQSNVPEMLLKEAEKAVNIATMPWEEFAGCSTPENKG